MRLFTKKNIHNMLILVVGFLLFLEWIRPLEVVTDTGNSYIFVVFTAVSFILSYVRIPFILRFFVQMVMIIYFIKNLYYEGLNGREWIYHFIHDVSVSIENVIRMDWFNMTNPFRSLLFFFVLWLICYCIYYLLVLKRRFFIFFFLTVLYLATLDAFTVFDGKTAIIRTMVFGLFILFYLTYVRIQNNEGVRVNPFKWAFPFVVLLVATTAFGYFLPKAGPQWPDPVPFIKKAVSVAGEEDEGAYTSQKIGYGENDEQLGGPFINDETPVFQAEIQKRHYWKVETKDTYTGKGWVNSTNSSFEEIGQGEISLAPFDKGVMTERLEASVNFVNLNVTPHIVYAPELKEIKTEEPADLYKDDLLEKVRAQKGEQPVVIPSYQISYNHPAFSIPVLKSTNTQDPNQIIERYTQLPERLPERVVSLAEEIIGDEDTRYEKVMNIQNFFRTGDFVYETEDVAVPGPEVDYVDQFIFDTKKGYCDNFSTSMVVLLRALDIPARWVKGYTQGDYVETVDTGVRLYEVKNSNAHSWVEVYFPNVGWVPFEPTRGFRSPYVFKQDWNIEQTQEEVNEVKEEEVKEEEKPEEEVKEEKDSGLSITFTSFIEKSKYVIAGVPVLGVILYVTRNRWIKYYLVYRIRSRKDEQVFFDAYEVLLRLLKMEGYPMGEGQTLREYAEKVDQDFNITSMSELTNKYELCMYRRESASVHWEESKELWENLIKKISA